MPEAAVQEVTNVRDRLLNAAEQVAIRDGVQNLTLEAVAREAGVSKGGLLYHFPSKSLLITAIVDRLVSHCESHQCKSVENDSEAGAFSRAYISARAERLETTKEPIHAAILAAAATDPQLLSPIRKRILEWQQKLESDGIDPAMATIIRLAIDGLGLSNMLGLPVPSGELRRQVIDMLMDMTHKQSKG